jgi:hypothetical protein
MVHIRLHCRAITKTPETAQTSTEAKYDSLIQILDTIVVAQRSSAWKIFVLPGTGTDTTDTTTV